eukprot:7086748-Pyramimonas_sp.AAC.2
MLGEKSAADCKPCQQCKTPLRKYLGYGIVGSVEGSAPCHSVCESDLGDDLDGCGVIVPPVTRHHQSSTWIKPSTKAVRERSNWSDERNLSV